MNKIILSAIAATILSGCSTIVSKSDYPVTIHSNPEGATFSISNEDGEIVQKGLTPSTITLDAGAGFFDGETYTINLKKEGYFDNTYTLESSVDGWYFGNILFGGLLGMLVIDPATGAMFSLPDSVNVELSESEVSSNTLNIISIEKLDTEQRSKLIKI
ncbi:hypothetical protein [Vibrio diabolicus]|uniref:hypothetical protein n=1 Tax=Vibrio diabolicus TaxID=50719 RepID=UPI0021D1BF4C|nr:hypothetical protein [Vibrio diabolicus]